ncbi:MAG: DegT/DnrJ/EryC1/StrS family aminotransferase [Pyrinomonadaceae bacterium]
MRSESTGRRLIPVAEPFLTGNEKNYVFDCLESGWISGSGKYVEMLEEQFAAFCGTAHGVSVVNGTAALHVALLALGVGPGDEVIVPDLTYIASANAVAYCGARPVFADVDRSTWTVNPEDVARRITSRTKAIMPVHLYGHPADMDPILDLARAHELFVIEDAAQAHGAEYKSRRVGAMGEVATFSFYGNKIMTTGEGGMVTTNDLDLAQRVRLLKGQGVDPARRYWFPIIGYNYRLTNIQAAIGLAQFEKIDWLVERRREVAMQYRKALQDLPVSTPCEAAWAKNVYWLYSICVPKGSDRDFVMNELMKQGIETRPFFYPMHQMPPYYKENGNQDFPVSTDLGARGINLPSSANLSDEEIAYIANALRQVLS